MSQFLFLIKGKDVRLQSKRIKLYESWQTLC